MELILRYSTASDHAYWLEEDGKTSTEATVTALNAAAKSSAKVAADVQTLVELGWKASIEEDDGEDQVTVSHRNDREALVKALDAMQCSDWMIQSRDDSDPLTVDEAREALAA